VAETLFYLLSAATLAFAVGVVRSRMPLFSVLNLLGAFACLSVIYLLAGFQFLAATQLLVYAGAIMVLFLFVIMLLNLGTAEEIERHAGLSLGGRRLAVAGVSAALLGLVGVFAADVSAARGQVFAGDGARTEHGLDQLDALAQVLFSRYALAFEAASLLLLATMIAVVLLAKRQRGERAPSVERGAAEPAPGRELERSVP
jgi:NADH-quinone oxidoreductase subunit J